MTSHTGRARSGVIALLLLLSGICSLVYQNVWLREFRHLFGGTALATSVVFAVFMGGLGLGGLYFGSRADKTSAPLRLYGGLELGAAGMALVSLPLLKLAYGVYVGSGGVFAMGPWAATALRLGLATVTIGPCAFLMGGNVPAAIKFAQSENDVGRRGVAILYGLNTLGAVLGTIVATFWCLEHLGSSTTLIGAGILNGFLGLVAFWIGRKLSDPTSPAKIAQPSTDTTESGSSDSLVPWRPALLLLAFSAGFVFFAMELTWMRLLIPLMGGTVYVAGAVLMVVLAGIGIGALVYAIREKGRPPTATELTVTLVLFSAGLAVPLALGDRLAVLAVLLNQLRGFGFTGQVCAWTLIASPLVFFPSVLAGYQFPLIVGLLGRGNRNVGRDVGWMYGLNTAGSILGSLLGGLVLLPALGAVGLWRAGVAIALAMAALSWAMSWRRSERSLPVAISSAAFGVAILILTLTCQGPTAFWRHTPIGYGSRIQPGSSDPRELGNWMRSQRRSILTEWEGVQSHIGVHGSSGLSLYVNGKSDGSARGDAATMVMTGLIGAILHDSPQRSCVIGLGTGSTAGWLADVPGMERVDVIEIEPRVADVARMCSAVNRNALAKANVNLLIGDGREALLTRSETYDLIASEPSNPYRAGIASLYTREFYQAVEKRLATEGMFLQWIQAYEINAETLMLLVRTLRSVFPEVQTWQAGELDLLFVCSRESAPISLATLDAKLEEPLFRQALEKTWLTKSREEFWAHHIATGRFADRIARDGGSINTDDRNLLEFYFARNLSGRARLSRLQLRKQSQLLGAHFPPLARADLMKLDKERLALAARYLSVTRENLSATPDSPDPESTARLEAFSAWERGDLEKAASKWGGDPTESLIETLMMAEAWAEVGDERAEPLITKLDQSRPIETNVLKARLAFRQGDSNEAIDLLSEAFKHYSSDPWPLPAVMERALSLASEIHASADSREISRKLFNAIKEPFALQLIQEQRMAVCLELSKGLDTSAQLMAVEACGEHFPITEEFLELRLSCYKASQHSDTEAARRDLEEFLGRRDRNLEELFKGH